MVLAGVGTGKTTVMVERVRHLLETDPTLEPENILVLTYNVRAAGELTQRLERALGIERAGRLWVHNFHSFGYRLLRDHRAELGLSANADILDQVGQRLLLRSLRPLLKDFLYHRVARYPNAVDRFADVISRAKDELVSPPEYREFADARRTAFQMRWGVDAYGCRTRGSARESTLQLMRAGCCVSLAMVRRRRIRISAPVVDASPRLLDRCERLTRYRTGP